MSLPRSSARSGGDSILANLVFDHVLAPWWERARARRIGRLMFAECLRLAELEPWAGARWMPVRRRPDRLAAPRLIYPASGSLVHALDREAVGRRALEQLLAIRSWQFGHGGEAPGTLDDLCPSSSPGSRSTPTRAARSATSGPRGSPTCHRSSRPAGSPPNSGRPARASRSSTESVPTGADDGGKVPFLPERPGPGRHRLPGPLTRPRAGVGFARVRSEVPVEGCRARPRPLPTPERSS